MSLKTHHESPPGLDPPRQSAPADTNAADARHRLVSERVVPLRRPWRWIASIVVLLLLAQVVSGMVSNPSYQWDVFGYWFFQPIILEGLAVTLKLTAYSAVIGFAAGIVLALMRLSRSPVLQSISWLYIWIFRSIPLIVLLLFLANATALYPTLGLHELTERAILRQRAKIGFVFQSFNLFPHLTVLDNVIEAPIAALGRRKAEVRAEALTWLERVGLADKAGAYPRQLSGGQQQRVAIARALALNPRLILFDEPTSALDPELVGEVLAVIKDLAKAGTTLIIVTHEIAFAREVADHVIFLDGGRVVEQGPPAEILDRPQHPRTAEFLRRVR